MKAKIVIVLGILLLGGMPLFGAIYMKIEGIQGESTSPGHEKWIDVMSYSFGVTQGAQWHTAVGAAREGSGVRSIGRGSRCRRRSPFANARARAACRDELNHDRIRRGGDADVPARHGPVPVRACSRCTCSSRATG